MSNDWPQGWYRGEGAGAPPQGGRSGYPRPGYPGQAPRGPGYPGQSPQGPGPRPSGGGWPDQPPPGGGRPSYQGVGGAGRRWRFWGQPGRHGRRILTYFVTLVVVVVLVVVGSYFWLNGKLKHTVTLPASTYNSAGTNWLITGADSRAGLSRTERDALHVGSDMGTLNSDSIMLLHTGGGKPVLISIPRDSYVDIPGHGMDKINAALALGGPTLLIKTVESTTGLNINHYMGIGFGGLVNVVNAIGGIHLCLPTAMHDTDSGVNLPAGCHNLNGAQTLEVARDRHSFATGDLQRIQDQRAILKALLDKAMSPGVILNPFTAFPFGSSAASSISVDKGTNLYDLIMVAMAMGSPQTGTVPIANPDYVTSVGDAVEWNRSQALQLFHALKDDKPVPSGLLQGTKVG
ncbi:MAG: LCP family protein [Nocardiopsaceae bacterium]|nr:LCP family protein [Nocardiopsaceae bacterium]